MMREVNFKFGFLPLFFLLVSCSSPSYVDSDEGASSKNSLSYNKIIFHVYDAYKNSPPNCVAILPFTSTSKKQLEGITIDQAETVRRAFYAHLSPQGKRDVELPRINFVLSKMENEDKLDLKALGEKLNCESLVQGNVTEYGTNFYGVYSKVSVGADLTLVRAASGELLWEGSHVARSHGGSIPMSPIGLAMGIYDAAKNVREEQVYRIIDDLARRLVSTIPDNQIVVLEEPIASVRVLSGKEEHRPGALEEYTASLEEKSLDNQKSSLIEVITANRFGEKNSTILYEALVATDPSDAVSRTLFAQHMVEKGDYTEALEQAEKSLALDNSSHATHFLKGRILIKLGDLKGADQAIIKAVAMDKANTNYLNGLGYVSSLRGNNDRALAAYRISIKSDPLNGYAYYNMAVIFQNLEDTEEAADAFYAAGLAYIKSGNYGPATKALTNLKDLAKGRIDRLEDAKLLEDAIKSLTNGK